MASIGLGWIGEPALAELVFQHWRSFPPTSRKPLPTASRRDRLCDHHGAPHHPGSSPRRPLRSSGPRRLRCWSSGRTELFMRGFWPFNPPAEQDGPGDRHCAGPQRLRRPCPGARKRAEVLSSASQEAGVLEEQEEQMLHRVFDFADMTAGRVIVPRTELAAVEATRPATSCCRRSPEPDMPPSRVPERSDNVVGSSTRSTW